MRFIFLVLGGVCLVSVIGNLLFLGYVGWLAFGKNAIAWNASTAELLQGELSMFAWAEPIMYDVFPAGIIDWALGIPAVFGSGIELLIMAFLSRTFLGLANN